MNKIKSEYTTRWKRSFCTYRIKTQKNMISTPPHPQIEKEIYHHGSIYISIRNPSTFVKPDKF